MREVGRKERGGGNNCPPPNPRDRQERTDRMHHVCGRVYRGRRKKSTEKRLHEENENNKAKVE
jgi:hypothetical protein